MVIFGIGTFVDAVPLQFYPELEQALKPMGGLMSEREREQRYRKRSCENGGRYCTRQVILGPPKVRERQGTEAPLSL